MTHRITYKEFHECQNAELTEAIQACCFGRNIDEIVFSLATVLAATLILHDCDECKKELVAHHADHVVRAMAYFAEHKRAAAH